MNKDIINLLKRNGIMRRDADFLIVPMENTNPFKTDVLKIYSRLKNRNYIVKKCSKNEIENLNKAYLIVKKNNADNVVVLKPLDGLKGQFLFNDLGIPLNKIGFKNEKKLFTDLLAVNEVFLKSGYIWRGIALRNIFFSNGKYTLIDFEKFYKINKLKIGRRELLFIKLNLLQSFSEKLVNNYIKHLEGIFDVSNNNRKMDGVEKIAWQFLNFNNRNELFDYFDDLTINAEKPLDTGSTIPFEIAHIIDEVVSPKVSFLLSVMMFKIRNKNPRKFRRLLEMLLLAISKNSECILKKELACIITSAGSYAGYRQIKTKLEYAKRHQKTESYDDILIKLTNSLCNFLDVDFKNLNIIARGSYGEAILTKESDLDFEIVRFNNGCIYQNISMEELVCEILSYMDVDAEGTAGRPLEKDVVIGDESRDFFEIFELRLVHGTSKDFLTYINKFKKILIEKKLWKDKAEYELSKRFFNSKTVFEELRFLITRLVLINCKHDTSSVVKEKIKKCPKSTRKILKSILDEIVFARNNFEESGLEEIMLRINKIRKAYGFPINNFIMNKDEK